MAVQTPTFTKVRGVNGGIDGIRVAWGAAGDSDTFQAVSLPEWADKSIQAEGTFSSAHIKLLGSNDSTTGSDGNFEQLNDAFGNAIDISAAGIKQVTESTVWVKPSTGSGSGSSVTVTMFFRRVMR